VELLQSYIWFAESTPTTSNFISTEAEHLRAASKAGYIEAAKAVNSKSREMAQEGMTAFEQWEAKRDEERDRNRDRISRGGSVGGPGRGRGRVWGRGSRGSHGGLRGGF
jgi:hypothetical protein